MENLLAGMQKIDNVFQDITREKDKQLEIVKNIEGKYK